MNKKLTPRAKEVQFYMKQHLTRPQIGKLMNISRQRVGQIIKVYQLIYPKIKSYQHLNVEVVYRKK